MKFKNLTLLTVTLTLLFMGVDASSAVFSAAQSLSEEEVTKQYGFTFPIGELGNCQTIAECGNYCKKDGNLPACMAFVKKYQITKDDVLTFTISELDNCQMGSDCRNFCNRDENIAQCIDFADKYDLLSTSNIELAQKFTQAVGSGGGPGGCKSLEQCERYCDDSSHTNECLDYVGKKNLLPIEELNRVRKVAEGFRQGAETPGHCRDYTECNVYCADYSHVNECSTYAKKVGYFSSEQAAEVERFLPLISRGAMPGGCKSKEACEEYCANDTHQGECADFSLSAGFLSKEDAEAIKKYGGSGPGGCKSKDECETYCNNPSNQNACLQYAKEHEIKVSFSGPGGCSDIDSCTKYCMEHKDDAACKQYVGQYGGSKGPGGCSDEASCTEYCKSNYQDAECQKYSNQYGGGFSGPGGCTSVDECKAKCQSNPQDPECQKYAGQYGGFSGPGGCNSMESCRAYCQNSQDPACAALKSQYGRESQTP
ncbi:hypothetical protein HY388_00445 [Candidatus Daviesbacteria bacterium]|nr:hypothetical protein [Candidatus Daviesbacteria bacterium]